MFLITNTELSKITQSVKSCDVWIQSPNFPSFKNWKYEFVAQTHSLDHTAHEETREIYLKESAETVKVEVRELLWDFAARVCGANMTLF